jgi:hypothetical protein
MDSPALFKQQFASFGLYLSSHGSAVKHVQLALSLDDSLGSEVFLQLPWNSLAELQSLDSWRVPLSNASGIHAQYCPPTSMPKDSVVRTAGTAESNSAPAAITAAAAAAAPASGPELLPSGPASSRMSLGALTALTSLELMVLH